ncbi:MAG TPA: hypothetical protein VLV83_18845 [Acidobacteriota bacterium]|nr:hypothetical protein [Acidobacteriota bacterium]
MDPERLIASRLHKELKGARRVGLGRGIPQALKPMLPQDVEVVDLNGQGLHASNLDVAVVEAREVTPEGHLSADPSLDLRGVEAKRWIAAMRQTGPDGLTRIVRRNRLPVSRQACIQEIVTELALIEVQPLGFVLREVAPGVSSDDVRHAVDASLHVADDLRVMEW